MGTRDAFALVRRTVRSTYTPSAHGAHDYSSTEGYNLPFFHYVDDVGINPPNVQPDPSFSNMEEVILEIEKIIGL